MTLKGVYTALITPFGADQSVDEGELRAIVDFQIEEGISGLVPMGTTGESPTVTHEENVHVIEVVAKQAAGRVPVIAGTGSNSTAEAIDMTRRAKDLGADATLQVAPYYNKPSQEGMYRHFTTVAEEGGLPVLVYNIPGRTGKNIENDTMLRLAKHPGIMGVKEASGSLPQMMDLIERKPEDFIVLSGDDNLAVPLTLMGGRGVVSVASNLLPGRMTKMIQNALDGNVKATLTEHYALLPFFKALFLDTNPIPIKYAMYRAGKVGNEMYRLPLCPMNDATRKQVDQILKETGVIS